MPRHTKQQSREILALRDALKSLLDQIAFVGQEQDDGTVRARLNEIKHQADAVAHAFGYAMLHRQEIPALAGGQRCPLLRVHDVLWPALNSQLPHANDRFGFTLWGIGMFATNYGDRDLPKDPQAAIPTWIIAAIAQAMSMLDLILGGGLDISPAATGTARLVIPDDLNATHVFLDGIRLNTGGSSGAKLLHVLRAAHPDPVDRTALVGHGVGRIDHAIKRLDAALQAIIARPGRGFRSGYGLNL